MAPAASEESVPPKPSDPGTVLPVSVSSRTEYPRSSMCIATDAAPDTAHSKAESGPAPKYATARVSSSTVHRARCGCSSRRTISSPYLAVERQCTRRRSSPWR